MNKSKQRQIEVHAHWAGFTEPILVGFLHTTPVRGKEIFSFEYDHDWLNSSYAQAIDPALQLLPGQWHAPIAQDNFGVFLDSSPDRWGRFLMNRREAELAREEKRDACKLMESDYLLAVYDEHSIGALRFRTDPDGIFLDNKKLASPTDTLRELAHASLEIEKMQRKSDYSKWLKCLLLPVDRWEAQDPRLASLMRKHLWIAKFLQ